LTRSADSDGWLIRGAQLGDRRVDCRLSDGIVQAIGSDLGAVRGEQTIDAHGGELLPGLADHHLHLFATAAASQSLDLAGGTALPDPHAAGTGWLRVIGAGAELRRSDVDHSWPNRPVRVQHRSGALWTLNSAAIEVIGAGLTVEERESGQVWRGDDRLRALLSAAGQASPPDLPALSRKLAALGVTHVTDATPDLDATAHELLTNSLDQRLVALSEIGTGPRKILLADHARPDFDALVGNIRASHDANRPVAVHTVTATTLAMTIAALRSVGTLAGDRIEHAAVCDDGAARQLAELGVVVVTQPSIFARHHKRFAAEDPRQDQGLLWRYGALVRQGVRVVASSDAPYGEVDPWQTIGQAVRREPDLLTPSSVLASMLSDPMDPGGPPRRVERGAPADLCLLTEPLDSALDNAVRACPVDVAATFIAGNPVHRG
jgi:predicted amidohydrolase YtcJ